MIAPATQGFIKLKYLFHANQLPIKSYFNIKLYYISMLPHFPIKCHMLINK